MKLSRKAKQALSEANLEEITKRLLLYASRIIRYNVARGLPEDLKAPTLVGRAIKKLLSGEPQWDPDKIELLRFLMEVVRNDIISYLVTDMESTNTRRLEPDAGNKAPAADKYSWGVIEGGSRARQYARERKKILEALRNDPIAYRIAELVIDDDIYAPEALAKLIGIPVRDIYNAKQRLCRALYGWQGL